MLGGIPSTMRSRLSLKNGADLASLAKATNARFFASNTCRFASPCFSRKLAFQRFNSSPRANVFSPVKKKSWEFLGGTERIYGKAGKVGKVGKAGFGYILRFFSTP